MQTTAAPRENFILRLVRCTGLFVMATLGISVLGPMWARAVDIREGELSGTLDTTITLGASWRMEDRDQDLIGVANGGRANSLNVDDGNLNYDQGDIFSASSKVTHELDLRWRNFGFFGRMFYFYDAAVMDKSTDRTPLGSQAERDVGKDLQALDAYLTADFEIFEQPLTIRAGSHVLSWGESTFIQNGINVINPVDVSKLRVAGSELRDALIPVPMLSINANLISSLSIEAFYQLQWEHTEIEPAGSFFSTSDFASPGGENVFLGFGQPPGMDNPPSPVGSNPPVGTSVPRSHDREPDDLGQGGVALRFFSQALNDTEFGLFYLRYHSRLPVLSGRAGEPPPSKETLADLLDFIRFALVDGDFASTAEYFREFPEDIDMLGVSFNTDISALGLAVQGEISYRWDQPLQVDDVELLFSAVSPLDEDLRTLLAVETFLEDRRVIDPPNSIFGQSQLGTVDFLDKVEGFRRKDMVQPQLTLTKLFGPMLGADQVVMVAEFGATWILDMEETDELRYEGPGTFTSGNPFFTQAGVQPETQTGGFADDFSWGYRIATRADFNNAIGPVGLQPSLAFFHDVNGTTPSPVLNFVEDRKVMTASLTANYLDTISAKISYTAFFDGGDHNLVIDRDFIQLSASYSF